MTLEFLPDVMALKMFCRLPGASRFFRDVLTVNMLGPVT